MTVNCEIIRDLLPLYFDGALSETSCAVIREHLQNCHACRLNYKQLKPVIRDATPPSPEVSAEYGDLVRRIRSHRNTSATLNAAAAVIALLAIAICIHKSRPRRSFIILRK